MTTTATESRLADAAHLRAAAHALIAAADGIERVAADRPATNWAGTGRGSGTADARDLIDIALGMLGAEAGR